MDRKFSVPLICRSLLTPYRTPRVELRPIKDGELASKPELVIPNAHGEDVVRSLFADTSVRLSTTWLLV